MKYTLWVLFVYALLILVGGVIGFVKAQSVASLSMGIIFGLAVAGCAIAMMKGFSSAFYVAALLSLTLSVFFAYRFMLSYKFMPAGMMCLMSVIVLSILLWSRVRKTKQNQIL